MASRWQYSLAALTLASPASFIAPAWVALASRTADRASRQLAQFRAAQTSEMPADFP